MKKIAVTLLVILLSGCASIINGTNQNLTFNSNPQGAKVYLDGIVMGTTPFTFQAKKNRYNNLRVEKEGYETVVEL
jgi:hypothetical protein